jgi:hypothetical protein
MGGFMRENREILARYESAFGKPATLIKSSCYGKWAGTIDYSIKIGDSTLFIGNSSAGQKYLNQHIVDMIEVFEKFIERKAEILQKIKSLQPFDDALAEKMGLQKYDILDVDFARSGMFIGWFYIKLKIGDAVVNHMTTGFDYGIRQYLRENREFSLKGKKYYTAGSIADSAVDFVFHGSGFSTKSKMYTVEA